MLVSVDGRTLLTSKLPKTTGGKNMFKILTDSFRETVDTVKLDTFLPSAASRASGQALAPPTICPWMAVPRTVPSTSIVMPARGHRDGRSVAGTTA